MLSLIFLSSLIVADGSGWLARAEANVVSVSTDGGAQWRVVHRCGDPLGPARPDDHAATACAAVAIAWHAATLYISCPDDGQYRWTGSAIEAEAVTEDEAIAERCVAVDRVADASWTHLDVLTERSVYGGRRPRPPPPPTVDLGDLARRARRAAWLPQLSVELIRLSSWDDHTRGWRRVGNVELFVWLSWDLDRNQHFTWEGVIN